MKKQFVMLSGLPRTGSTLLTSILSQNPKIYAEGNSALCQLMWDAKQACNGLASEQLNANNRLEKTEMDIVSGLPYLYYKDVEQPIIVDKCRSWTVPANIKMLRKYLPNPIKMIVLTRKLSDVIKSLAVLRIKNNFQGDMTSGFLEPMTDPVMIPALGVVSAKKEKTDEFLFISYEELTTDTENTLKKIYDFCGWEHFQHDLQNIVNKHPENDEFYGVKGLHDIRSTISPITHDYELSEEVLNYCNMIDCIIENPDSV